MKNNEVAGHIVPYIFAHFVSGSRGTAICLPVSQSSPQSERTSFYKPFVFSSSALASIIFLWPCIGGRWHQHLSNPVDLPDSI